MQIRTLVVTVSVATAFMSTRPASAQTVVDDFTSGSERVVVRSGTRDTVQPGTMMGSFRFARMIVGDEGANPRGQAGVLDIKDAGDPDHGYFIVNAGYQSHPRIELVYGLDAVGGPAPLHKNLAELGDRFRVHFDGCDGLI